jgi:YafQ family addiction module toxin component
MEYNIQLTPSFEKQLKKIEKRDNVLFERVSKKIEEIKNNPEHFKPLIGDLAGCRRVHIDPFIIIFEISHSTIILHYIKHHDEAY